MVKYSKFYRPRNNHFSQKQSAKTKKAKAPPCETAHDDNHFILIENLPPHARVSANATFPPVAKRATRSADRKGALESVGCAN